MISLWGEEFEIDNLTKTKKIINKIKKPAEVKVLTIKDVNSKKISLKDKISLISEEVYRVLAKQVKYVKTITSREELHNYISDCIAKGVIAIDTETNNSLDPITCKLMGLCLFTDGRDDQVYIPVNHINPETGERLVNQVTEEDIREELQRIVDAETFIIMHNAKFDMQVIKCTCGISLSCNWDTSIAAKLLNENEKASLKEQYIIHIDPDQEKYSIEKLFKKEKYEVFPPELFAIYAATDAMMTFKLYKYQKELMFRSENSKIKDLFFNIEMPCVEVVAAMELAGVELDLEYSARLSKKYRVQLEKIDEKITNELRNYEEVISNWRLSPAANARPTSKDKNGNEKEGKSKSEQLESPINISSPTQLAILIYDVLGMEQPEGTTLRGTGKEILEKIDLPLCKYILERREVSKLLDTYIDALPEVMNKADGRLHCHFNQYGADTGRFSSSDPNLQNIPSHNKEIRMMFKAKDGYNLIGSDFSQQEPRLLSQYSQDENMINAYKQGKDLYATIASGVYKMDYWDCMEKFQDGTPNPSGKKRRTSVKSLLLGIMYGRGVNSIAEQINGTIKEAQDIIDNFYKSFPSVKNWMDETNNNARKFGYVEDLWGRRRRLPDILLPKYEIKDTKVSGNVVNPFIGCPNRILETAKVKKYKDKLREAKNKSEVDEIKSAAKKDGVEIKDNGGFISKAERQCVNARIQGGAATMTKIAMNKIHRDQILKDLGFTLLIGVHDELIGECPKENTDAVADRLTYVMRTCIEDICDVPFKCDADVCDHWYYNDYADVVKQEYNKKIESGMTSEEAFTWLCEAHCELLPQQLLDIVKE